MNLSAPFIRRPIGTLLLTIGLLIAGVAAFLTLPVSPLPQVDIPTVSVRASLPGASPETMATSVATPLERRLGTIADVTEITSQSGLGNARVTLQFGLDRDIDGAARDVAAAIQAARADLPSTLKQTPTYQKVNPADAPIMILALTSNTRTPGQIYDAVSTVLSQQLLQIPGVGDVELGGGSLPAVRVEVNLPQLDAYGLSIEDVRAAVAASNANRPKGVLPDGPRRLQIYTNDNGTTAADYQTLPVAYRNGAPVLLRDVASVTDGVEDVRTLGLYNGRPAVVAIISRQPGANIIATVDAIRARLPILRTVIPADVQIEVSADRTRTIRASLRDVELTLVIATVLVLLVVRVFLGTWRATIVPAVAVVASLAGTVALMAMFGFSLNNLSLMALTVATGFVVDDAIVVLENISRRVERGEPPFAAALAGAAEVGPTVVTISISLVAVFIPLLFMGGIIGRLFFEFAVTLSAAVLISLVLSLTTTPMLAARLLCRSDGDSLSRLRERAGERVPAHGSRCQAEKPFPSPLPQAGEDFDAGWFGHVTRRYARALDWSLANPWPVLAILAAVVLFNVTLYLAVPKGFFPQQDSGTLQGGVRADQSISFQALGGKVRQIVTIIHRDPGVDTVVGFTGGGRAGGGFVSIALKDGVQSADVMQRLRPKLSRITGAATFVQPAQDVRIGGRGGNSAYQYTLKSDSAAELAAFAPKLATALRGEPTLTDVDSDAQAAGLETYVTIDRATAGRLGITNRDIDNALYSAFGQRQVSTIYRALNQYNVVMAVPRDFASGPDVLNRIHVPAGNLLAQAGPATPGGSAAQAGAASRGSALSTQARAMVPLSAIARFAVRPAPTQVNHQDAAPAATVSFNLAPGVALSDAQGSIARVMDRLQAPASITGAFSGTAKAFAESTRTIPLLILAAIVVIYLVLGILYESLVHPLTALSTLPSAGIGAIVALMLAGMSLDIIALIGLVLLIGIVQKNAILIIDFALQAERDGASPLAAIREASLRRFRPIIMTTLAALFGAVPLAVGLGTGSELRQPLGVAIIGGLLVSQALTLLTTPAVYRLLDRLRRRRDPAISLEPAAA